MRCARLTRPTAHGRAAADPFNYLEIAASVLTLGAGALNVCNDGTASGVRRQLQSSDPIDWLRSGQGGLVEWPFNYCTDGRIPLAGRELLAIVVLTHWLKLGRVASQSIVFGPLFQCVLVMLKDTLKWLVLGFWPLIAFTSCFTVLFREPYGDLQGVEDCDVNFDKEFETWFQTLELLIEIVLKGGDVDFFCIRASSVPAIAWLLMVLFVLVTVIMLVNLLIALMAKSFDNMFEQQQQQ